MLHNGGLLAVAVSRVLVQYWRVNIFEVDKFLLFYDFCQAEPSPGTGDRMTERQVSGIIFYSLKKCMNTVLGW